jgi:hypothetical protein
VLSKWEAIRHSQALAEKVHAMEPREELFLRITRLANNTGATDEHRALNYLTVRYLAIYAFATERHAHNYSLTALEVRPSHLSGVRKVVEVVFSYTHRQTNVTEKFPFLDSRLEPYYEIER